MISPPTKLTLHNGLLEKKVPNSISLVAPESKEANTPLIYLAK